MRQIIPVVIIASIAFLSHTVSYAQSIATVYSFDFYKENYPTSNLVFNVSGNTLYGHTGSILYQLNINQVPHALDTVYLSGRDSDDQGYQFDGDLTISKDMNHLYGVKNSFTRGAIFKINLINKSVTLLHEFDLNTRDMEGYDAQGGVVISNDGRYLYGVTQSGGSHLLPRSRGGVIYRLTLDGSDKNPYKVLYSFSGDKLNGGAPAGSLVLSSDNQSLYGVTTYGGQKNCGTLFRLTVGNETSSVFKTLHDFDCTNEAGSHTGGIPNGIISSADGRYLYGTAYKTNWTNNNGIIFQIDLHDPTYSSQVLHQFNVEDGVLPNNLSLNQDGNALFGTTQMYGLTRSNHGSLFKLSLDTKQPQFTPVYFFNSAEGFGTPENKLLLDSAMKNIYGTTRYGGEHGDGTIFRIELKNS